MLHSESGVAELDCVFETALPGHYESVWTCSRYEPNEAIDYVVFSPGMRIEHLSIRLSEPSPGRTRLEWTRAYTAITEEAEAGLEEAVDARMSQINRILDAGLKHYLATGALMQQS